MKSSKRYHNLDPLRGFLALCVVLSHIPLVSSTVGLPFYSDLPIFHRGQDSVLVFFCLSGYLIIGLLFDEKKRLGSISIKNFYVRRILRLYPVYYLVLIIGFVYYHYALDLFNVDFNIEYSLLEGIAWNVGFLPNVFKNLYDVGSILEILWSIGVEEQFYLLVAPLLFMLNINKYFKSLLLFTLLYFIIYHLPSFNFFRRFEFYYFFMSIGGLFAVANKLNYKFVYISFTPVRFLIYGMFILNFFTDFFLFDNVIYRNIFRTILFALVISNLALDKNLIIKNPFLNYLGKISYGIYMYHMIVVNFILFIFLKINFDALFGDVVAILIINFTCISLSLIVSHLSYKYFENYFLGLKEKFRPKPTL